METSQYLAAIGALVGVIAYFYRCMEKSHNAKVEGLEARLRCAEAEVDVLRESCDSYKEAIRTGRLPPPTRKDESE